MKLTIPGLPFQITFAVSRRPDFARGRFSLGWALVLIAIVAVGLGPYAKEQRRLANTEFARTYPVADLVGPDAKLSTQFPRMVSTLTATAAPKLSNPAQWAITPFFLSRSLIVRTTPAGHRQVQDWLRRERERRGLPADDIQSIGVRAATR